MVHRAAREMPTPGPRRSIFIDWQRQSDPLRMEVALDPSICRIMPPPSILLVEDDENDIFIARRALQKTLIPNPLVVVRDGREAIAYLQEQCTENFANIPSLVLLDINLPVMGGFEVLNWVRSQKPLNRLIVILFSSSRHPSDVAKAYDLQANSYLVKRSSLDETIELFKSLLSYWLDWNETPNLQVADIR